MSFQFKDNEDREWDVDVNVATVKIARDLADFDLLDLDDGKMFDRLREDPILLSSVIYCICKEQADERGISGLEFDKAMYGDAIDNATEATLRAIVSFFPNLRVRGHLELTLEMSKEATEIVRDKIDQDIEQIDVRAIIEAKLAEAGESSTSSPGSSA